MRIIEDLIKELLAGSPALNAVLTLTETLEQQRDEMIGEIRRLAADPQRKMDVVQCEELVHRYARLETAIVGIYAILNVDGDPTDQVIKIARIVEHVASYKSG